MWQTRTHKIKLSNQMHWHARCWHEAAFLQSHWLCCSGQQDSFRQPSPWMQFWPSQPRCVLGCWASLEPQHTPPARQNQTAGRQWARCQWPWRRTLWATLKPGRCTQRTERALRGFLKKEVRQVALSVIRGGGSWTFWFGYSCARVYASLPPRTTSMRLRFLCLQKM